MNVLGNIYGEKKYTKLQKNPQRGDYLTIYLTPQNSLLSSVKFDFKQKFYLSALFCCFHGHLLSQMLFDVVFGFLV